HGADGRGIRENRSRPRAAGRGAARAKPRSRWNRPEQDEALRARAVEPGSPHELMSASVTATRVFAPASMLIHRFYYGLKPYVPWRVRMAARRASARRKRTRYADVWPIDPAAATPPEGWAGWPDG